MFKTRLGIYTILKISLLIKKTNGEPDFQSKQSHMYVCVEKKNLMINVSFVLYDSWSPWVDDIPKMKGWNSSLNSSLAPHIGSAPDLGALSYTFYLLLHNIYQY
jgi:hypothetical protein